MAYQRAFPIAFSRTHAVILALTDSQQAISTAQGCDIYEANCISSGWLQTGYSEKYLGYLPVGPVPRTIFHITVR
ncbi:hypothetical protein ABKN59_005489 [Abortiporus biennis]